MDLKADYKRLMEVLALKRAPIAVTYTNEAQPGDGKSRSACGAIWHAYQGNVVVVTPETSACPGGQWYLGLAKSPREGLEDFLVNIEHIFASLPCARSYLANSPAPPVGLAEQIVFAPLDQAELQPDLVIFAGHALVASRVLGLVAFDAGMPLKLSAFGATCHTAVGNPVMTGLPDISFIDVSSRKQAGFSDDELLITLPWRYYRSLVENLDRSICGTAKPDWSRERRRSS